MGTKARNLGSFPSGRRLPPLKFFIGLGLGNPLSLSFKHQFALELCNGTQQIDHQLDGRPRIEVHGTYPKLDFLQLRCAGDLGFQVSWQKAI